MASLTMSIANQKQRRDEVKLGGLKMQTLNSAKYRNVKHSSSTVMQGHMNITEGWFDGEVIEETSWEVQFSTSPHSRQNLIHVAITYLQTKKLDDIQAVFTEQALSGIELLVLSEPSLFTERDSSQSVPMFASLNLDVSLLVRVLGLLIRDSFLGHLNSAASSGCDGENSDCPLLEVAPERLNRCKKKPKNATGESHRDGDRALRHADIDVNKLLQEDNELRKTLRDALRQGAIDNCLKPLLDERNYDETAKMPVESFKTLLKLCPDDVFSVAPPSGITPLHIAVRLYESALVTAYSDVSAVIQALIERCPSSIFLKAGAGAGQESITAYRILENLKATETTENSFARSQVRELLKEAYIGYRAKKYDEKEKKDVIDHMWSEKKELLYADAKSQRHFLLSLMGESVTLDKEYIETLMEQSGMEFETVLEFVELPYWKPQSLQPNEPQPQPSSRNSSADTGIAQAAHNQPEPDPYPALFSWLSKCRVTKIFEVKVDDDGPEAHTDAAIREALRGKGTTDDPIRNFKVEIWNWKKFDMCAETVAYSAPDAREVHLYSRGNTAVLRGWACDSSFANLQKLAKIYIDIYPQNPRDDDDCERYREALILGIRRQCPFLKNSDVIVYNHKYRAPGSSGAVTGSSKNKSGDSRQALTEVKRNKVEWLNNLQRFTDFLINLDRSLPQEICSPKPVVRIALLDDGCKLDGLRGAQKGYSFRSETDTFFVGSCSHGTQMADCIRRVCPIAELVIVRLDDTRREEKQRFTISSCCKALKWALDQDVDVISMSWTFEHKDSEEDDSKTDFAKLVAQAVKSNKVLFGALSDNTFETRPLAPAGLPGVIKIGSATIYGEVSRNLKHIPPDFILPGEKIDMPSGQEASGSPFATAFAAGLAAVVLYCLKLQHALEPDDKERAKALRIARTHAGMTRIFNALSGHGAVEHAAGHFVQPYHTFGQEFPASWDDRVDFIRRIVGEMLPSNVVRKIREPM